MKQKLIAPPRFLQGGGEMGAITRNHFWDQTPLGEPGGWPQSLRTTLSILLNSRFPMFLFWGPDHICFYNDAYRPSLGKDNEGKHPCVGKAGADVWPEIWHIIGPQIDQVMAGGEATWFEDQLVPIYRNGRLEDAYWTYSYSPVEDESGKVAGVFVTCTETTKHLQNLEALRASQQRFGAAVAAVQGILWTNNAQGEMQGEQPGWAALTGQRFEEYQGYGWSKAVHPEDAQPTIDAWNEAVKERRIFAFAHRVRRHDGEWRLFSIQAIPVFKADGSIREWVGVHTDITEERKRAEALRKSEGQLRMVMETASIGLWNYDIGTNETFFSDQSRRMYGLRPEEPFTYERFVQSLHPEDRDRVMALNEAVLFGPPSAADYKAEFRVVQPDGSLRWLRSIGTVLRNEKGERSNFIGAIIDLTEEKLAAAAVEQSERKFRHLIQSNIVGVMFWNLDGSILDANQTFLDMLGYSTEDLKAGLLDWSRMTPPQWAEADRDGVQQIEATGQHRPFEKQYLHKNGTPVDVIIASSAFNGPGGRQGVTFVLDITERKKAEQALAESEQRFRHLADDAPLWIWQIDKGLNVQYANKSLVNYVGLSHYSEFTDKVWEEFTHPEDVEKTYRLIGEAVAKGEPYAFETRSRNAATGEYEWFYVRGVPRMENGAVTGYIGTGINVQQQKLLTNELERLVAERTRELQRSNEDLQQFAHVASHDLKEPLRKIMTFESRLREESGDKLPGNALLYLDKIQRAATRMYSMINGVLDYSTLSSVAHDAEPVNLNRVMEQILSDLEVVIAEKGAAVRYNDLPVVSGSPVLLQQLFYNLLNNSLKFSRAGVSPLVTVTASSEGQAGNGRVRILFADNGIGFDPQYAADIFTTFMRLNSKDKFEGTGLGLALCKKIVERHGGTIKAEGKPGEGATFVIELPVNAAVGASQV